tara:strand:+ start:2759 stop:3196 length:438 start_codon:yes stop_codon:yes gene_type:complete
VEKIESSGSVNDGLKTEITMDQADNRMNFKVTGSTGGGGGTPTCFLEIWDSGMTVPGGIVYTTFSSDGLAGRNVTTPVHSLVGTVDQTIVDRGGRSYLNTHGYGSAGDSWFRRFRDNANDSWGPVIFDNVGSKAALYAAAYYKGC